MGAKIQAFDIFQTPLSSHYPLPLMNNGEQVPEVGCDNLLDPGEAGPEVNHLLEDGHFIFHILVEIVDKLQKNKREKTVKKEQ